jgi:flagellar biosynthetic protein FlhB
MEDYFDLQLFAQEKTEKATPKKRRDVREKGNIPQSRELNSALALIGCFAVLYIFASFIVNTLREHVQYMLTISVNDGLFSVEGIQGLLISSVTGLIKASAPVAGAALCLGIIASYVQVGFVFTTKPLMPNFNRLNPVEGFKRIFSRRTLVQLLKSLIKIGAVGYLTYRYLIARYPETPKMLDMEPENIMGMIGVTVIRVGILAGAVLLALAIMDLYYQRYEHEKSIMMTKQEIKEEYKQIEGNPQIKSKIKETQRLISMRRMMSEVPKADVVITNPTHLAVALKYQPDYAKAPYVVAKGKDLIALKIKEIATENEIQLVENVGLARSLFETTDIGDVIPPELYQAVAEVLAFVYSIGNNS